MDSGLTDPPISRERGRSEASAEQRSSIRDLAAVSARVVRSDAVGLDRHCTPPHRVRGLVPRICSFRHLDVLEKAGKLTGNGSPAR